MDFAGEILHGKTSPLCHDAKGLYTSIPQDIPVARYHSLAGTHLSLPDCLEVSSWSTIAANGNNATVIMGVRHKSLVVEGVQFHPESILTTEGRSILRNFLRMRGGTWQENEQLARREEPVLPQSSSALPVFENGGAMVVSPPPDGERSILEEIYNHQKTAVKAQAQIPSLRFSDLEASYRLNISPPQLSFLDRIRMSPYPISLMAEIKRASPSKGVISLMTCAPAQARTYALAGASVISVLTEPKWFKGNIEDLRSVRQSLEGFSNRPAILRKDFIFDEYQILEARLAGADSVLLIVKMLEEAQLARLYQYSVSLKMEPLVEVNNVAEMNTAIKLGARVIGVNNRNLISFEVDLETTSRLVDLVPSGTVVCALSGISSAKDVQSYTRNGVQAVLVGEALMRASEPATFIRDLLGGAEEPGRQEDEHPRQLLVKICGTRTADAARVAIDAGADLIGMILVEGRTRSVPLEQAMEISRVVHGTKRSNTLMPSEQRKPRTSTSAVDFFEQSISSLSHPSRALLVGVFQNQSLSHILAQQKLLTLDVVQLHGSEPLEWTSFIPVPVIRSFQPDDPEVGRRGYHTLPLLDSAGGGLGQKLDMAAVVRTLEKDSGVRIILAGGLNAVNLKDSVQGFGNLGHRIAAVDVSSGVEEAGAQSFEKIRAFLKAAKEIR